MGSACSDDSFVPPAQARSERQLSAAASSSLEPLAPTVAATSQLRGVSIDPDRAVVAVPAPDGSLGSQTSSTAHAGRVADEQPTEYVSNDSNAPPATQSSDCSGHQAASAFNVEGSGVGQGLPVPVDVCAAPSVCAALPEPPTAAIGQECPVPQDITSAAVDLTGRPGSLADQGRPVPATLSPESSTSKHGSSTAASGPSQDSDSTSDAGELLEAPKAPVDVTKRGVSLAFLLAMVQWEDVQMDWTIQQVVDLYVRPVTAEHKCCFFDIIPEAHTGLPCFFISHTWSRTIASLLSLLVRHFRLEGAKVPSSDQDTDSDNGGAEGAGTFIWLDIVAINQHPYVDKGFLLNDDVANLEKVIRCTQRTLFCLDEKCVALSRIWCLYEVWKSFEAGGPGRLLLLMQDVSIKHLDRVFDSFDVMLAQATQPKDRTRILEEIAVSQIGPTAMNLTLKRALVDSARSQATDSNATGAELAGILSKAARMLHLNGEDSLALPMSQRALEELTAVLGAAHPASVSAADDLGNCLRSLGRFEDALTVLRSAVEASKAEEWNGVAHSGIIVCTLSLATCLELMGRSAEALPLLVQLEEWCEPGAGRTSNPEVFLGHVLNCMASCHSSLGHAAESLAVNRRALTNSEQLYGPVHPNTLAALGSLACALERMGDFQGALPLLERALKGSEEVLGLLHPSTLSSVSDLATCLSCIDRLDEALALYHRALQGQEEVLGALHGDTLISLTNFGATLVEMGKFDEARPCLRRAYEGQVGALGESHGSTIRAKRWLEKAGV